ncbi:class I mannose-6-phosphate isomerase [bacterium]|nr:class I mannose-6-phosphate isomerase [bacterium]
MAVFYPMKFKPYYRAKVWGGRCLTRFFNRPTPNVSPVGESIEIVDNPNYSSTVAEGPLAGISLTELCKTYPVEVYGHQADQYRYTGFPVIFKYINAEEALSVQVHPDDRYAMKYENGNGKFEAWYIVDAKPNAVVSRSVKPGVTLEKAKQAIRKGQAMDVMHTYSVEKGQSIIIPPGTIHALGRGIIAAEVSQNSDITYRAYDFNRTGVKGESRPLQIEKSVDVLKIQDQNDFVKEVKLNSLCSKICLNDCFSLYKYSFREPIHDYTYNQFRLLCNVEGHGTIISPDSLFEDIEFHPGDTILIPACLYDFSLVPATHCVMLEVFAGKFDKNEDRKASIAARPQPQP